MASDYCSTAPASKYHHFVPQFILRNFSHTYKPHQTHKKRSKSKPGIYPGDKVINGIDLSTPNPKIIEMKVSKTFGVQDLYIDAGHPTNQQHIEEMFSKLENNAAQIISKIKKSFEGGEKAVALTRGQRNTIRKFVFIMKYRKPSTYDRFCMARPGEYLGDDKEIFVEYMRRKGFTKPIEVWLDNIKAMLEIKMDVGTEWEKELGENCYPLDAMWFVLDTSMFYMSLCTPSNPDDEFLMTENGYGIHEGPVSIVTNRDTVEVEVVTYTEYHTFAHISPKLTIVLRSFLLPLAVEDGNAEVRGMREEIWEANMMFHHEPEGAAKSFLQDLPVTKPLNSYSQILDGRAVYLTGEEPTLSQRDIFYFRFFPISVEHVAKINVVFLEEAYPTSIIAFNSKSSVRKALEYYLSFEGEEGFHQFKLTGGREDDERLVYLKKLEQAVKLLGGDMKARYRTKDLEGEPKRIRDKDKVFDMMKDSRKALKMYNLLCQKEHLDPEDFEQAQIMLKLRIKIDTWTKGLDESFRERVREDLRDFYCKLPIQRLWIYLKRMRFMSDGGTVLNFFFKIQDSKLPHEHLFGPEDAIAKVNDVFLPFHARRIMYYATNNHLRMKDLNFGLKKELTIDDESILRLKQEVGLTFGSQGSICDCGILCVPDLQDLAVGLHNHFALHGIPSYGELEPFFNLILRPEQQVEMAIRATLKAELDELNPDNDLKKMFDVLLGIVYPIFGDVPSKQLRW